MSVKKSPPASPPVSPPCVSPGEAGLRDRILTVAVQLFADRGYGRTSMREVAKGAGCTKPALYYHFDSKDDLFRAAIDQCMTGLDPLLKQVALIPGTVRDRIIAFARSMFEVLRSDPAAMRIMLALQTRPDHSQPDIDFAHYHERNQIRLQAMFSEGVATGEISKHVDLQDATLALTGMLHARAFLALKGLPTPPDVPERIVAMLFDGIRPPSPPSSPGST